MKVIILRGISGSGKSWLAGKLAETYNENFRDKEIYPRACILSADKYFMKNGEYLFDAKLLPKAHGLCLRYFMKAFVGEIPELCIIDNTNTRTLEVAPYYAIAQAHDSIVKLVTVMCQPDIAWNRNTHGTPTSAVWQQHQHILHEDIPPWWNHVVCFRRPSPLGLTIDALDILESME